MQAKHHRQTISRIQPHPVEQHIGRTLRTIRRQKGMSMEELAIAAGISHQQIYKIEHGLNRLSLSRFHTLTVCLGIAPDVFLQQAFNQDMLCRTAQNNTATADSYRAFQTC